jgi:hypothetical protein
MATSPRLSELTAIRIDTGHQIHEQFIYGAKNDGDRPMASLQLSSGKITHFFRTGKFSV